MRVLVRFSIVKIDSFILYMRLSFKENTSCNKRVLGFEFEIELNLKKINKI